jgi:hypothetical protein
VLRQAIENLEEYEYIIFSLIIPFYLRSVPVKSASLRKIVYSGM